MEADVAMYEAKGSGRDRAVLFTRDAPAPNAQRAGFVWTDRIKRALREDMFAVYAQPIASLERTEHADRYELLVRMIDEDGNVVAPGAFLPGRRALRPDHRDRRLDDPPGDRADRARADRGPEDRGRGEPLGPFDLRPGAARPDRGRADQGADRSLASSSSRSPRPRRSRTWTRRATLATRIRRWGCRFALDDFGAGFGSFYYLKYLPVDYLKIDGEFIRNLDSSEIDQRMVSAMVEIARASACARSPSSSRASEILERLRELQVDFAQGYHVGKPAPVERSPRS